MAPATTPPPPVISTSLGEAAADATPSIRLAVDMIPSLAPSTAARSQPMRATRWFSLWRRRIYGPFLSGVSSPPLRILRQPLARSHDARLVWTKLGTGFIG